jgi:hypothetical protein
VWGVLIVGIFMMDDQFVTEVKEVVRMVRGIVP